MTELLVQMLCQPADQHRAKLTNDTLLPVSLFDFLQTVQRLADAQVRHTLNTKPLRPAADSSATLRAELHSCSPVSIQDGLSLRRNRQTLNGGSSGASASVAPLYQSDTVRGDSDAEISTQFGGTPFQGGSMVCATCAHHSNERLASAYTVDPAFCFTTDVVLPAACSANRAQVIGCIELPSQRCHTRAQAAAERRERSSCIHEGPVSTRVAPARCEHAGPGQAGQQCARAGA